MKLTRRTSVAGFVVLVGLLSPLRAAPEPVEPRQRPSRQYTIQQFMDTTNVRDASFSADEKEILFSSDQSGIFNAYRVPVAGGDAVAVTRSTTDSTFAVGYFPFDGRLLYTRDQGGNENNHLYLRTIDGEEMDLTPGDKLKAIFAGWSRDGRAFHVLLNDRDPRFFDLYRFDAGSLAKTLLFEDSTGYSLGDVSSDEKWIAFTRINTTADSDLYLYDVEKKEMKHLTPHEGNISYSIASFSPDGKWLYYLTDKASEFSYVSRVELASMTTEEVERADWDIAYTVFSHDGKYRVSAINEDGSTVIKVYDVASGRPVALPKLPEGDIRSVTFSRSETKMAVYVDGDRAPSNLYVLDLVSGKTTRLTDTLNREIDPDDLVEARVERFSSFDGMTIPNILYVPLQASASARAPAILYVHGGPGGQTRRGYNALIQYLANHGYAVLGINNRGSSGYGKSFFTADDRRHGHEPLLDCVEGKEFLASMPEIDGERIGILGGSYGGYMVLAALAFQPDVFRVGVDLFGVSNWIRTLESIPPYWESIRKMLYVEMGDPEKDRAALEAVSPLLHADQIRRPLLVLQGRNDPRVIEAESAEIVAAVKKNGVPVEYVVFDDEGHGFTKKKNRLEGYEAILEFLDRYLKSAAPESPAAPAS